jgi:site-specific recombinase XerD
MDRKAANRIVQRNLRKADITGKRITPHSFRHSFVTLALNAGCHVRDVQNSLGYSDSRMIAYYDRDRDSLPRHSTHMVSAWVEGS